MDARLLNLRPNSNRFQDAKVKIVARCLQHFHHHQQHPQTRCYYLFRLEHPNQAFANDGSKPFLASLQESMDVLEPLRVSSEFMGPKLIYSK